VDFHCKRLAFKLGLEYEVVKEKCATDPDYKRMRKEIKTFSFQRAYGAGVAALSEELGLPHSEIKKFIRAEERLYPGVAAMHERWIAEVEGNRKPTSLRSFSGVPVGRGWMGSLTGKRYVFTEDDAPEFLRNKGKLTSFRPTQIKNYEVQGFAGEILKLVIGDLYRNIKFDGCLADKALLVNTVHDSVLLDVKKEVLGRAIGLVRSSIEAAPWLLYRTYGIEFDLPIKSDISVGSDWQNMRKCDDS
jgi:DNA polymerase I-like protein with 3'-5' exonuclease and polymerase domains